MLPRTVPARFRFRTGAIRAAVACLLFAVGLCPPPLAGADTTGVSFRQDIRQALARGGCNAGPCHGNANGKGGFKLSLRGEDPASDLRVIARELGGRRINPFEPADSLLLLKATAALAHEGGQRFPTNSWEYRSLHDWIAAGAPDDGTLRPAPVRLEVSPAETVLFSPTNESRVRATVVFADGSRRDVTDRAVYDPVSTSVKTSPDGRIERVQDGESVVIVRYLDLQQPVSVAFVPAQPGFVWRAPKPANFIDEHLQRKLRSRRQLPSGPIADEVFLRRLHLDLLGIPPSAEEARAFVADKHRNKRTRAIDAALERPEFADFWALKWSDLLRVEERTLDRKGMTVFHRWIRDGIATNRPLDVMAQEIVSARGSTYSHPPANFHRANRTPVDRALAISQVFLGTRLNCAQCHNHPFDRWSQDDYHDWAAVFGRVQTKVLRNDRRDDNDSHEFSGEQIVYVAARGSVPNPRTGKPAIPRFLGETTPFSADASDGPDELDGVGKWLTSHPQFGRVQVNRIWFHLFGRGLVDPIDDFRATNPASHPELLDALATDFVKHGHDLRRTLRLLLQSNAYQQSSESHATASDDEVNVSHNTVRRLTAEQLLDSQARVLGAVTQAKGWPSGARAAQIAGGATQKEGRKSPADRFLETFGKPPRLLTCECERSDATTLSQALQLLSGPVVNELITRKDNRLARWSGKDQPAGEAVEDLYWSILTRAPSALERQRFVGLLEAAPERRPVLEDIAWALLNSKEFVLRH